MPIIPRARDSLPIKVRLTEYDCLNDGHTRFFLSSRQVDRSRSPRKSVDAFTISFLITLIRPLYGRNVL